ncbi:MULTISPECIES: glycerol-3-phosphate dehydrogenase/oxidase [unclassified Meiothermus]|uniref:glycerol-3-phosphate dehydrogenase/oxidase n=1 Tax=unclassified Meiothermus TaxID=370471 RepID=UPI000D7CF010|nr:MULTISPECIES: FAD-dependent oxidoreductase [unclassified Meiothermus]PZA06850.1 glycerol-3-phosphate dehydrogenase [Meiothermus sp. Pnk-1]RYM33173.1 FAD-dependent oxidoreductase [Meiothermus sp. PNK-Is4]
MNRTALLERLNNESFDLLVIGGGASGAGVALDAATRGLKVALVERLDFAEGTSSRSTKLIHGGVRYLELAVKTLDRVQLNLVRDALHERATLLRLAPHLTRPLWLLTPLYKLWEMPYYWTGLKLYDLLAGKARLALSRYLSPQETRRRFPAVRREGLVGSVAYQDGQFDDARYNLELILTALEEGAVAVNYAEVTALLKQDGKLRGAVVRDRLGGQELEVGAKVVINATGPFSDHIRHLDDPAAPALVRASSGVHIVLDPKYSPPDTGLLIPHTEDGRVIFVLPWLGQTLVGTTDDPAEPTPHPKAREEEIAYILRQVEPYLGRIPREEVRAAWAGLRPLVARPQAADTARLARDHLVEESPSGLLTLTGGKWTTYRKMALDCLNYAVGRFGLRAGPSRTHERRLVGGWGFDPDGAQKLAQEYGLEPDIAQHLHRSYGSRAGRVAEIGQNLRLAPGYPYIASEVIYAARHELAQTPMDVLARRTRLAFLDTQAAQAALPEVTRLLAKELGWKAEERTAQEHQAQERLAVAI